MNGIHDLGGRDGFGRVERESGEPVFHAVWEGRVFGLALSALAGGVANVDEIRHAIERVPPVTYLTAGYYGRWLAALESLLVARGVLGAGELDARLTGRPVRGGPAEVPVLAAPTAGGSRRPLAAAPRFAPGDPVRTRNHQPPGHTRLPAYARCRRGVVERCWGGWVLPDANAHGDDRGEALYGVRFDARELFGEAAEPHAEVHLDLFESYLEPVTAGEGRP